MKKGIAMVTLVVVIAVMLILVSVITISGINASNTSKKITFAAEIKMVQESINSYRTNNNEVPVTDFIVIDLSNASEEVIRQFEDNLEEIVDNKVKLNKIDYTKLDFSSLSRGLSESEDDIYVVSSKTGIVYYAKGLKIGNNTYYTLTDELNTLINFNNKSDEIIADNAIICETSTTDWTNENVKTLIKVPKEYTNVVVSVGENKVNNNIVEEKYNVYDIEIIENCNINISYTYKTNEIKNSSFSVNNIDKQVPNIESNKISKSNTQKKYIEIKAIDLQSGIKVIKYDKDKINNDEVGRIYFNNSGIEVKENIIEIDNDIPYVTVYVEDNAGNYQILLINT